MVRVNIEKLANDTISPDREDPDRYERNGERRRERELYFLQSNRFIVVQNETVLPCLSLSRVPHKQQHIAEHLYLGEMYLAVKLYDTEKLLRALRFFFFYYF